MNFRIQLFNLFLITIIIISCYTHQSHSLALSPIEKLLFQSRLSNVQSSIEEKFPSLLVSSSFDKKKDYKNIILIFPGAGGIDGLVIELLKSIINNDNSDSNYISIVDWKEYRGSVISAAFESEMVGECIANCILSCNEEIQLEKVHSIGVSVGSFAANSFAHTIKSKASSSSSSSSLYTRLTLLDPFCTRGIWGIGYGYKCFGKHVDYVEHYLNTDDPVPSTNEPLNPKYCTVIDVTNDKKRNDFILPDGDTMHSWPLAYYSRYVLRNSEDKQQNDYALRRFYYGKDGMPAIGSIKVL